MFIKIIAKKCAFLIFFITILSCENNRLVNFESHINEIIAKNKSHGPVSLKLDTITSFAWDSLLVVGPYSFIEKISEKEGVDLNKIPNTIQDHDRFILIVFLNNNEGIKWIQLDRTDILKNLFRDGNGYSIYPKGQSSFILKN